MYEFDDLDKFSDVELSEALRPFLAAAQEGQAALEVAQNELLLAERDLAEAPGRYAHKRATVCRKVVEARANIFQARMSDLAAAWEESQFEGY